MKILCLTADASSNSVVRVYPVAKVLERNHEVTIAGFRSKDTVFPPYAQDFDYHTVKTQALPHFARQARELARSFDADLVYAFKPLATSLWTGLASRRQLNVPLALDIEDWELGWYLDRPSVDQAKHLVHVERPNGMLWSGATERLVGRANYRFVVSRFLQRRFGGVVLRHGVDTALFDPARWSRTEALEELGVEDCRYVLFAGTPMRSKGLEDVLEVLQRRERPDVRMLIVGSTSHDPAYAAALAERFGDVLTLAGPRPHGSMPALLSLATLVALPQRLTRETIAQVPGKVFEAMAMGKAIVATAVSDLPEILDGCGYVTPPGDQRSLERALIDLLDSETLRRDLGVRARERCQQHYSWDAMERIIEATLRQPVATPDSLRPVTV